MSTSSASPALSMTNRNRGRRVLSHEIVHHPVRLQLILDHDLEETASPVHGRLAELRRAHLAEPLEPRDVLHLPRAASGFAPEPATIRSFSASSQAQTVSLPRSIR